MRPSTLIAILIAVVLGLVGVTAARLLNLFGSPPAEPSHSVLAANQNIVKGALIETRQVKVRPLRGSELEAYRRDPTGYLPPLETAIYLRIARENILADSPIRSDQLEPFENPEGVPERLAPNMKPVNLAVKLDDSSGGLLRVGDWVNVMMTSLITGPNLKDSPRQVTIIPAARIILKRNTLRPIYTALPSDKPVPFTIETNSHRASLTEFARDKGDFSLVALPEVEGKRLEAARQAAIVAAQSADPSPTPTLVSFVDPRSEAYRKELRFVGDFEAKEGPIGGANLEELFGLTYPPPPGPRPPVRPNSYIQQYMGSQRQSDVIVSPDGRILARSNDRPEQSQGPRVINTSIGSYMDPDELERSREHPIDYSSGALKRAAQPLIAEFTFRKPSLAREALTAYPNPEAEGGLARAR